MLLSEILRIYRKCLPLPPLEAWVDCTIHAVEMGKIPEGYLRAAQQTVMQSWNWESIGSI